MTDIINEKHLLWWVLKAVDANEFDEYGYMIRAMEDERIWKDIDAPGWVLPAIREKIRVVLGDDND